jgi:hypothetical protein
MCALSYFTTANNRNTRSAGAAKRDLPISKIVHILFSHDRLLITDDSPTAEPMMIRSVKKLTMVTTLAVAMAAVTTVAASAQSGRCDTQARSYADRTARAGENVVGGAIAGGVGGAVMGGIFGGSRGARRGAAWGAGAGAVGGAVRSSREWRYADDSEYDHCMRRANYRRPAPRPSRAPEPWTDAWYDYCSAKYRSFDEETGYYRAYSGNLRFCR